MATPSEGGQKLIVIPNSNALFGEHIGNETPIKTEKERTQHS